MSLPLAKLVTKNMGQFKKGLHAYDTERIKAGEVAVRVEAYRLRNQMKKEVRGGGIAGHKFKPLRAISKGKPSSRRKPLAELGRHGIRYWAHSIGIHKIFSVGFDDDRVVSMSHKSSRGMQASVTWRKIAKKHQEGFETDASEPVFRTPRRAFYARIGGSYEKLGKYPKLRKFFFILKSTKKFKTPARPIVEPFWKSQKRNADLNIISNFNRKMRGERI